VQYYGNNLAHTNDYTMLRLGKVYFSEADYQWLKGFVTDVDYGLVSLSHNAYFEGIYMSQMNYEPSAGDPHQAQLLQDLSEFRPAPNGEYFLPDRDPSTYELDNKSVLLHNLMVQFPFLADMMGMVEPQAAEAFPVQQQCATDFLWQRNPFVITACGSDYPTYVHPGVDYLVAYWLAAYHKIITKDL